MKFITEISVCMFIALAVNISGAALTYAESSSDSDVVVIQLPSADPFDPDTVYQ